MIITKNTYLLLFIFQKNEKKKKGKMGKYREREVAAMKKEGKITT